MLLPDALHEWLQQACGTPAFDNRPGLGRSPALAARNLPLALHTGRYGGWAAVSPAGRSGGAGRRPVTIDLGTTGVEVGGRKKRRVAYNHPAGRARIIYRGVAQLTPVFAESGQADGPVTSDRYSFTARFAWSARSCSRMTAFCCSGESSVSFNWPTNRLTASRILLS